MKETIVISAFPACGKSYMCKNFNGKPYTMLDSDSSKFSWIYDENGNKTDVRNPNFIEDYINHIKENIGKVDVIFVSSHKEVRKALLDNNIDHSIILPGLEMKDEMLRRMKERGNDEKFIKFQSDHYEEFIKEIYNDLETYVDNHILLILLSDRFPYINNSMISAIFQKDTMYLYDEF